MVQWLAETPSGYSVGFFRGEGRPRNRGQAEPRLFQPRADIPLSQRDVWVFYLRVS